MKTNEKNLTKRILIPLGLTLVILLTISIVSIYWLQRLHLNEKLEKHLEEVEQLFQMKLDEDAKVLESQINLLQLDKNIQNAYLAKDRDALLRNAMRIFNAIRTKYQVTHFYFIDVDKVCFLRVHNPPRYGDTIPRFTLAGAMRQGVPVYGIELGKFGTFTLRIVYPWRINGELVGYIELGKEIEHITVALKKILDVELFFFIKKSFLNRADWEEGLKMMGRRGNWAQFPQFVIIDRTMPIYKAFNDSLDKLSSHSKDEHLTTRLKVSIGDKQYHGGFVPLIDVGNRKLGDIIVLNEVSKQETALQTLSVMLITFSVVIGGGLFGFFYIFIGRIEAELLKVYRELIAAEKLKNKLATEKFQQQGEFLQSVIDSLDHPFYIINTNNYQIEIANSTTQALGLWPQATCYALTHKRSEPCTGINDPCPLKEVKSTKKPIIVEHIHFDKEGNPRNIEVHGFPVTDQQGNITQMIEYSLDITERKRVEQQLHRQNEQLKVQNEQLDAFARQLEELQKERLYQLNKAYERFVPSEFLSLLDKQSILDVHLGDQVEKEITVLFSDIREFTRLSEKMTPQQNFEFINTYLGQMAPIIHQYNGFIDKYIGDAIMALFPTNADDAVSCSIAMLKKLRQFNQVLPKADLPAIKIGIGLNTGPLMLGTVGGQNRMEGTVISDAVNLASRVEQLTKTYGTALLITEQTYQKLTDPSRYKIRVIDRVTVNGKTEPVTVYEVFEADRPAICQLKLATRHDFEQGFRCFHNEQFNEAQQIFEKVLQVNNDDKAAQVYLEHCRQVLSMTMPERPTLLIVDDNPLNIKVLSIFLSAKQFNVLIAKNGKAALKAAELKHPHLILLDVMMPGMDGFETCQRLKADAKTKDIPVIFITALSDTADKIKGFKLGAVDYITKPFKKEEVLSRVNTHLSLSFLQQQLQVRALALEIHNLQLKERIKTLSLQTKFR